MFIDAYSTKNQHWLRFRLWCVREQTFLITPTMITSSMEIFSALLAICAGNSPVHGEFPAQRPVTRSFGIFFYLHPNKRLSKQSLGWWFGTPQRPLWRHGNAQTTRVIQFCNVITTKCVDKIPLANPMFQLFFTTTPNVYTPKIHLVRKIQSSSTKQSILWRRKMLANIR